MTNEVAVSNAQLPVTQRAAIALGITEEKKAALRELAAKSVGITVVTNGAGRQQLHALRVALKNERLDLEKQGKRARQDAVDFSKAIIELEKEAIEIVQFEEKRLQGLQDDYDDAEEKAKQAAIQLELDRMAKIDAQIEAIRRLPTLAGGKTAEYARKILSQAQGIAIDETFEEKTGLAQEALEMTLLALAAIVREREENEAQQLVIAMEREELARLRALQVALEAAEREKIAEEARKAKEAMEVKEREARAQLAAEQAEFLRQNELRERIAELRGNQILTPSSGSLLIAQHIGDLEAIPIDKSFQELEQLAHETKHAGLIRLHELLAAAQHQETEQARMADENKRLAAERTVMEREQAQARQRNEMAMQELQAIDHQKVIARTGRTPYFKGGSVEGVDTVISETEGWEITEEKFGALTKSAESVKAATLTDLKAYRAELIQQKADAEKLKAEEHAKQLAKKRRFPGADAIVDVLAEYFGVSNAIVLEWLGEMKDIL